MEQQDLPGLGSQNERTARQQRATENFVARCLEFCLAHDWTTPEQLFRQFAVRQLVAELRQLPSLRAKLLCEIAGLDERIASLKSDEGATEDLELAILTGRCDASCIFDHVGSTTFVRLMKPTPVWDFLNQDSFWRLDTQKARARLRATLEIAAQEGLLRGQFLFEGAALRNLLHGLSPATIESMLVAALQTVAPQGLPRFVEQLLHENSLDGWIQQLGGETLWQSLLQQELAHHAQFEPSHPFFEVAAPVHAAPTEATHHLTVRAYPAPPSAAVSESQILDVASFAPAPPPSLQSLTSAHDPGAAPAITSSAPTRRPEPPPPSRPIESSREMNLRFELSHALEAIDRLPERSDTLSTETLMALHKLYFSTLGNATTDAERVDCFFEAFESRGELLDGLAAIAEHLDARMTPAEIARRNLDEWGLVQTVIFLERRDAHRAGRTHSSMIPRLHQLSSQSPPRSAAPPARVGS